MVCHVVPRFRFTSPANGSSATSVYSPRLPMAASTTSFTAPPPTPAGKRVPLRHVRCLPVGRSPSDAGAAPPPLRLAVAAVTELLRAASPMNRREGIGGGDGREGGGDGEELAPLSADDVVAALRVDFGRAYFLTGNFNAEIYSEDCLFEDPTISFRGREKYSRNLELLVPFFLQPSLYLEHIEKNVIGGQDFILAKWKLRACLKLPWRPLITVSGITRYELNMKFKIVRHSESWDVSALEAVGQIFTPSWWRK